MKQILICILCCSNNNFSWKDFTQIILAITTVVISVLTYKLAKKISFKKTLKDRQFEVVCEFIKDFSSSLITISYQKPDGNGGITSTYLSNFRSINFKKQNADIFECKNFIVQEDGFNHFLFMHLIGNPFLPIELSNELRKLWFHTEKRINDPMELGEYVIISNLNNYENKNYSMPKGKEFSDFESFYNFINNIMSIANDWLNKHEASDLNFRN